MKAQPRSQGFLSSLASGRRKKKDPWNKFEQAIAGYCKSELDLYTSVYVSRI